MDSAHVEVSIRGKLVELPAVELEGLTIVTNGNWLKVASVHDEDWLPGESVQDPKRLIAGLRSKGVAADILTFADRFASETRFDYPVRWDNLAVIPLTTYKDWWEKRLPQESRRNVRIAAKRGVVVKIVEFDDAFIRGVMGIYNETPLRAGRPFWHYGKPFEAVKRENASYLNRSVFLGAYFEEELIGFIKMVFVGKVGSIMQILAKNAHADKRTSNALLAKAVEVGAERGMSHIEYCKYTYGNDDASPLTEFKRRNGFEKLNYPRYFVPLTWKGAVALKLRLHLGLREILPHRLLGFLLNARARLNRARMRHHRPTEAVGCAPASAAQQSR